MKFSLSFHELSIKTWLKNIYQDIPLMPQASWQIEALTAMRLFSKLICDRG
jgi:hypothetical protein